MPFNGGPGTWKARFRIATGEPLLLVRTVSPLFNSELAWKVANVALAESEPEAESCPVREWLRSCELHGGSFIDPCGLGTLMPEEETESPEEVRSQRRRYLPNVDE